MLRCLRVLFGNKFARLGRLAGWIGCQAGLWVQGVGGVTAGCTGAPLPAEASRGFGQVEACAGCFGGRSATDLSYGVSS